MTDPLFTVPVVGYRRWRMGYTNDTWPVGEAVPALMPHGYQSTGEPWVPGRNGAVCSGKEDGAHAVPTFATWANWPYEPTRGVKPKHTAPHSDCKCGLYAMHTIKDVLQRGALREDEVLGAVVGWGAIEVHADGWRAEHAMVVGLAIDNDFYADAWHEAEQHYRRNVRALAKRYNVPAVEMHDLPLIAERHGQSLPDTAKPEQTWTSSAYVAGQVGHGHSHPMSRPRPPANQLAYQAELDRQLQARWKQADQWAQHERALDELIAQFDKRLEGLHRRRSLTRWLRDVREQIQRLRDRIPPRRPGWPDLNRA